MPRVSTCPDASRSIFFCITNDGAKKAATNAVLKLNLTPDELTRFQEAMQAVEERYRDRNRAIHGAWGASPQYPDKLRWADIRDQILLRVEMMGLTGMANKEKRREMQIAHQKMVQVWDERDFLH